MKDVALQRFLLAETSLTLAEALDKALAAETANSYVKEIRGSGTVSVMPLDKRQNRNQRQSQKGNCNGYGGKHPRAQCKFKDVGCNACKKKSHIQRVCRNKSLFFGKLFMNRIHKTVAPFPLKRRG